jgi:MinD superfamily P-loop ATPase
MREIVVLSGKGGTGKTSLVGALAALGQRQILCDADVDAADLHLLLAPQIKEQHDFYAGHQAEIRAADCIQCGECLNWCRFGAISDDFVVNPLLCEGCGVCHTLCPVEAVDFPEDCCGRWFISDTRFGPLVHARLGVAAENSGKLVTLVRGEARKLAAAGGMEWILTDGPPGIGCPVISSLGDASAALIITEPTVSGQHDLERVAALADHFRIPALVLVNKADLHWPTAQAIREFCDRKGYHFLGFLPFTPAFTRAQVQGLTVPEFDEPRLTEQLVDLGASLRRQVRELSPEKEP